MFANTLPSLDPEKRHRTAKVNYHHVSQRRRFGK